MDAKKKRGFLLQGSGKNLKGANVHRATTPSAVTRAARVPNLFGPPSRRIVPFNEDTDDRTPPPLAKLLAEDPRISNVLGQAFIRRLTVDWACSTIGQLLALDRPQLDALLDALRPLPGHRDIFIDFLNAQRNRVEEERRANMAAAIAAAGEETPAAPAAPAAPRPSTAPPTTASQRRAWRSSVQLLRNATIAAKRGGDGHISHLIQQQPLHWGFVKGPGPLPVAYVSSTRVLTFGRSRVLDFGGPTPNSPPNKGRGPGKAPGDSGYGVARRAYDPDHF